MSLKTVPVMAARLIDPGQARLSFDVPAGTNIAGIVASALPAHDLPPERIRVHLISDAGTWLVPARLWAQVRPKPGIQVIVRTVPGNNDTLRSVLLAVVSIAAVAFAPTLGLSPLMTSLAGIGLTLVGNMLVNALIPVQSAQVSDQAQRNVYAIQGWQNEMRPNASIPLILGKHRFAPPFAASSWTEIVGDQQYIRALFTAGYGPLRVTDMRIGDTPIDEFADVQFEVKSGTSSDSKVSLYPHQILEEQTGVELVRPLPRDSAGNVIEGQTGIATPVTRFTAANSSRASIIFSFPQGLFRVDDDGEIRTQSVELTIHARLNGTGSWQLVKALKISAQKRETILRQYSWTLPSRGRWQIQISRQTSERISTQTADTLVLSAIQSTRPEYPVNMPRPVSLISVRVRATYQLNGALESFNALFEREGLIHQGNNVWASGYSRNPATACLTALMGDHNPYPVASSEIDWDIFADWYDFCASKGLKYDAVHDQGESLGDVLTAICSAGRASPRHDGVKWGVVVDKPQTLVIDHINARNSAEFTWSRNYFEPPHALRVSFQDETNEYEPAERIVPWPGYTGDITITEELSLPGKTDPDEIWTEARRRMYELIYRPDTFSAMQSGRSRIATRGDLVMGNFDVLQRTQIAARVTSVTGTLIVLDELIPPSSGAGIRFKSYSNADDLVGTSTVCAVADRDVETTALRIDQANSALPRVGEVIHFGPINTESIALRVRGVEAADDFNARMIMLRAAPEIDAVLDADQPPAWDGRVGETSNDVPSAPLPPIFTSVRSGLAETGADNRLEALLAPNSGSFATSYELDHRLVGASGWQTVAVSAASASASIDLYALDDQVELRARALAETTSSINSDVIQIVIGADDPAVPDALDASAVLALGGMGHASLSVGIAAGSFASKVQVYRAPTGTALDHALHAVRDPQSVAPGSTFLFIDGDATRVNLLKNAQFDDASIWTLGSGWSIASGAATHASGGGTLEQNIDVTDGDTYRIALRVSQRTAGSVTPRLLGSIDVDGTAVSSNGIALETLDALAGTTALGVDATSDFDGEIDDIFAFQETESCLGAGAWDYWIEPLNNIGVAGPVSGPFTVTIF